MSKFKPTVSATSSVIALCAATVMTTGVGASAQDANGTEEAVSIQDTVIVTATRRNESILDVPINISAVSGDQIEQQGFDDISELAAYVPGLNIVDQGGRDGNRIVVRGLNVDPVVNAFGQANGGGLVATYVGDIPLFVDLRLNDLERVETLLGPQGTLYGAGTMGGAIRYIPTKPSFEGQSFEVRADAYTYSEGDGLSTDLGFTVNYPISDTLAFRASVDRLDDQGFIDYPFIVQTPGVSNPDPDFTNPADVSANLSPLSDANTEEALSGRVALRWQPIEAVDATLTYYFQNTENGGRTVTGRRGTLATGDYEAPFRVPEPNERDNELLALEIVADLGFAELTSATGLAETTENGQRDQTDLLITLEYSYETFPTFTAFTFEDDKSEIFNQEFRLVSTGDHRYNWIIGAFYNRNEYRALSSEFTPGYVESFGLPLPTSGALEYFEADRTDLEETAIFGEVGFDITDKWDVTIGGRYYDYTFETGNATFFPVADYVFGGVDGFQAYSLGEIDANLPLTPNRSDDGTLFKLNTSYTFDNGNLIYATFSQGYRLGGSNGGQPCTDNSFSDPNQNLCLFSSGQQFSANPTDIVVVDERGYDDDSVNNYEIGAKTTWLDGDLIVTGSAYFLDWQDPQIASTSINAGSSIRVNAGAAETKGFDVGGTWQASDNLNLRGSYSYVSAEISEGAPSLVRTISPPGFGTLLVDVEEGDKLPGAPEHQFSFFANYVQPLGEGEVVYDFGYAWQDEIETVIGGRGGFISLPSYGRANAAISYKTDNWTVTGYAENLFDELSESSAFNSPLYNQTVSGANVRYFRTNVLAPRTLGVRFSYHFDQ